MKKEEEGVGEYYLQARIDLLESIIENQSEAIILLKEIGDSQDRRIGIQAKIIKANEEIIAIVEKQKAILEKDNLRLNIAIGIFLSIALVWCTVKIIML